MKDTNKVQVESLTLTASMADLKASGCVVKKIGFDADEKQALADAKVDIKKLDAAKVALQADETNADLRKAVVDAGVLFFKIDAKGDNKGKIVAIVNSDNQLYVNNCCDFATFGAGGIATRMRLGALYNCFVEIFADAEKPARHYDGVAIKCEKSLVDDRRKGKPADADAVDW